MGSTLPSTLPSFLSTSEGVSTTHFNLAAPEHRNDADVQAKLESRAKASAGDEETQTETLNTNEQPPTNESTAQNETITVPDTEHEI